LGGHNMLNLIQIFQLCNNRLNHLSMVWYCPLMSPEIYVMHVSENRLIKAVCPIKCEAIDKYGSSDTCYVINKAE